MMVVLLWSCCSCLEIWRVCTSFGLFFSCGSHDRPSRPASRLLEFAFLARALGAISRLRGDEMAEEQILHGLVDDLQKLGRR